MTSHVPQPPPPHHLLVGPFVLLSWPLRTAWSSAIYEATLKPNASPILELEGDAQDVHEGVGFGIESYFNSPLPWCLWWLVRWCLRVGLGFLEQLSNSDCVDCRLICCKSKSKVGMRLYCFILPLSLQNFKYSAALKIFAHQSLLSPFSVCIQSTKHNFEAKCLPNMWIRRRCTRYAWGG